MVNFENPPTHFGLRYANQTLEWLPTDTEENYKKLIQDPEHCKYLAQQGWDKPGAITYKLNSQGFRSDEFDGGPYMLALGCSYTIGIGLPDSATWARQTAQALGMKCANLAWGGYSADSCYRLAEYWIPNLKPDYVCMLAPPRHRIDLLLDNPNNSQPPLEIFLPQSQSRLFNHNDQYLKHWFLNDENSKINQRKNILAIKQICLDLNIPCTILDIEEQRMGWNLQEFPPARDFMHAGPIKQNMLTKKFVYKFDNNLRSQSIDS